MIRNMTYLNVVLTVIAVLLLVIVVKLFQVSRGEFVRVTVGGTVDTYVGNTVEIEGSVEVEGGYINCYH